MQRDCLGRYCLGRPVIWLLVAAAVGSARGAEPGSEGEPRHHSETLHGRVVWMTEALELRHGVRSVPEARERVLALETPEGTLHPLVEDVRGRAFRADQRLRERPVELLVRRHPGSPMIQVVRVFARRNGQRVELDYWCDICAIAVFELRECDCCQGPLEFRERPAPDDRPADQ